MRVVITLVIIKLGLFLRLLVDELVIDSVIKISIVILFVLTIKVFALRSKPNNLFREDLVFYLVGPFEILVVLIKTT